MFPGPGPDSGFTLLFEAIIMTLSRSMPVKTMAKFVNEHDTRLWRVLHHYVDDAREKLITAKLSRSAWMKPPAGEITIM